MSTPIVLLGRGRVGQAVLRSLRSRGVKAVLRPGRGDAREPAFLHTARLVWILVPDRAIADVARRVAHHVSAATVVAHASGASGIDRLGDCPGHLAVAHPLAAFGGGADPARGTCLVLQGDAHAARAFRPIAQAMGARLVRARLDEARYHAAAALAANGTTALAALAIEWMAEAGLGERDAHRGVVALLRTVVRNLEKAEPARALTGPIARGDAETVTRHLKALAPRERRDYAAVARMILSVAEKGSLGADSVRAIDAILGQGP